MLKENRIDFGKWCGRYGYDGVDVDIDGVGIVDGSWSGYVLWWACAHQERVGHDDAQLRVDGHCRYALGCLRIRDDLWREPWLVRLELGLFLPEGDRPIDSDRR